MKIADRSSSMMRFALLRHEMPATSPVESHWDLMLEEPDCLYTLRLRSLPVGDDNAGETPRVVDANHPAGPSTNSENRRHSAVRLADHRKKYLDYEGLISRDRGHVSAVARGMIELVDPGGSKCNQNGPTAHVFAMGSHLILRASEDRLAELVLPPSSVDEHVSICVRQWTLC